MMYKQKHQSRLCATKSNREWLVRSVLFQNKIWKIKNLFFFSLNTRTERNKGVLQNNDKAFLFYGNENLENNQFSTLWFYFETE